MSGRTLSVLINNQNIGTLHEADGIWAFNYTDSWLANSHAFALSPRLPLHAVPIQDSGTRRYVQWYFDNLLPEEGQRTLLAGDAKIDSADAFGLLTYYGAESAGSITLISPDQSIDSTGASRLRTLSDDSLSQRIRAMPTVSLSRMAKKKMSLAGAQHKLAINFHQGELFEPIGETPSTHILKPNHPNTDYPHSVINEFFVMRLAGKLGLNVPEVHRRYVPEPVYIIQRFDRKLTGSTIERVHTIDACQLLGLDKAYKYTQGSLTKLAELANACRSSAIARTRLFNWLTFNVLIGNTDAHLKNLSFLVSSQGIQLAPHYDMLSTACYETQAFDKNDWPSSTTLAWPIATTSKFTELNRATLLEAGETLMINRSTALRLLETQCQQIAKAAQHLYDEIVIENNELQKRQPELGLIIDGELRCLRTIQFSIIKDMLNQLG
ncbi:MAG TPA: HipA domain-containing protein [Arenimonas sp.]|nr:HipA domain-containing protein [Arenimonas sp.]